MTAEQRWDHNFVRRIETDVYGFTWDYLLRSVDWELFPGAIEWLKAHPVNDHDPVR